MDEQHDDGAGLVRAELNRLTAAGPPMGFSATEVVAAGRRRRRVRRGVAAAMTVATVGAVAAAILVPSVTLGGRPGTTRSAGVALPSASPSPPRVSQATGPATPTDRSVPQVSGLAAARARQIARECAKFSGGLATADGAGIAVTPSPTPPVPPRSTSDYPLRVYNLVRDAAGSAALIYGTDVVLVCAVGGPGLQYNPAGSISRGMPKWLPGPVAIDFEGGTGGGRGGKHPTQRGYWVIGGRVTGAVARVTVSVGAETRTVDALNGTFLVRFVHGTDWQIPVQGQRTRVRGYDPAGRPVGEAAPNSSAACYLLPDGSLLGGGRPRSGQRCQRAVPWI